MMPGENQAKTAGVAPDGTAGTCQNCAVLSETLHEYVASFLALKQKIFETDKTVNEFKEKCDELQTTQRENAELRGHLDELLLNLAPFENLHKNDVHMLEELERTKGSLRRCRDGAADGSREPEAMTLKEQVIFQLRVLQDSNLKQTAEVASLQKENEALECKLQKAQEKLEKLEKEANKEKSSSGVQTDRKELCSTMAQTDMAERCSASVQTRPTCESSVPVQTDPTEESMMDLGKIRQLVVDLWQNVDPQSLSTPLLAGTLLHRAPPVPSGGPAGVPVPKEQLSTSPVPPSPAAVNRTPIKTPVKHPAAVTRTPIKTPVRQPGAVNRTPIKTPVRHPPMCEESRVSAEEILRLFMPLPPLLSPVHHPDYLGGSEEEDMQLSMEEEEVGKEHHIFKKEDLKEVVCSSNGRKESPIALNGLKRLPIPSNGQKGAVFQRQCSKVTPPKGKSCQRSLIGTQEQEGDALCLQVSMNVGSQWSSVIMTEASESVVSGNEGSEEEKTVVDEDIESEMEMDEVMSADEACRNSIADIKWNPFAMYSSTYENNNRSNGDHSNASVRPATYSHRSSGSGNTNGVRHSKTNVENTEVKHNQLVNGSATPQNVKDETITCKKKQTPPLKPSPTDIDKSLKPQDKDQIKKINKKYTDETLRTESLKGEQNGHDQNLGDVTMVCGMGQNGHEENHHDPVSSRIAEPEQNPHSHIHDVVNSTLTKEKHTDQPHTPSDEPSKNASVTEEVCEAWGETEKPSEDVCVDTESSEDLDRFGLQRKVRMVQSRREAQQSAGSINSSLEKEEESKEEPAKDVTCSIDIRTPKPMAQGETVEDSADEDVIFVSSQNKNTDQSRSFDDTSKNGPNVTSALKNEQNMQPEVEPGPAGLPQVTKDKSTRNLPKDTSPVSGIHTPGSLVITNGTSALNSLTDGALNGNGFEIGAGPLSKDEGIYRRVKGMKEGPRPVGATTLMAPVESLQNIRSMMGPPLRPLVLPLLATPPRSVRLDLRSGPVMARLTQDGSEQHLALRSGQQVSLSPATTPSPCKSVPSSPLQFGSATPKHAVPVPCRHPVSALNPMSPAASVAAATQENSMAMLDSMYPELSAQARTLSILRGNVSLPRPAPEPSTPPQTSGSTPVSCSSGFNSEATAFTKTQQTGKRVGTNVLLPKSAKKLRLGGSPVPVPSTRPPSDLVVEPLPVRSGEAKDQPVRNGLHVVRKEQVAQVDSAASSKECVISQALAKLAGSCFDLLEVVKSHVFIKRISSVPILTDEEREVVSDFCTKHKSLSDDFLSAILAQLKTERTTLGGSCLQSLCRVYTALCRQNDDRLKANTLAYSLLKEDFPDAAKLILFMVTTWPRLLTCGSGLCKAIHTVAHIRAEGEVLRCLSAYLQWESSPPCDIPQLISSTLEMLRTGDRMQFRHHSRHGDDLCPTSWEYIFTIDLLCAQQKWKWTHDNIISKELWPLMNSWATQPRSQKGPISDVTVAAVLRLIGKLGQQGMKERFNTAVRKIASVINVLGKQGQAEGVPWEVQLAVAYTMYDLSPSNPKEALAALAEWRGEATARVPPGITSCLTQISSLSRKASS